MLSSYSWPAKLEDASKRLDLLFRDKKQNFYRINVFSHGKLKKIRQKVFIVNFLPSYKIPEIKAYDNEELSYSGFANIDNEIDEKEF